MLADPASEQAADLCREQLQQALQTELYERLGRMQAEAVGTSMLPTLWPGDRFAIERRPLAELRPQQLIGIRREDQLCVHRLLAIQPGGLLTCGDALDEPDPLVPTSAYVGAVVQVWRNRREVTPAARRPTYLRRIVTRWSRDQAWFPVWLRLRAWRKYRSPVWRWATTGRRPA